MHNKAMFWAWRGPYRLALEETVRWTRSLVEEDWPHCCRQNGSALHASFIQLTEDLQMKKGFWNPLKTACSLCRWTTMSTNVELLYLLASNVVNSGVSHRHEDSTLSAHLPLYLGSGFPHIKAQSLNGIFSKITTGFHVLWLLLVLQKQKEQDW